MTPSSPPSTNGPAAGASVHPGDAAGRGGAEGGGEGGHRSGPGSARRAIHAGAPWTRMLFIGAVCFSVWLLLDAPSLQQSATLSPVGTRRTVSLDVVGPIAALSRGLGLSHGVGWTDEALGRTPGGGPSLAVAAPAVPVGPARRPGPHRQGAVPGSGPTGGASTPTTSTLPLLNQSPTAADPLRVLVVGDSIGLDLGQPLVSDLAGTGVVTPVLDGRVDTGLSRPDYFDWPAELRVDLTNHHPQVVVVMMGANDPQSLVGGDDGVPYGSPAWNAGYGQRVGAFIDEATSVGAHVLWVGMPPMAAPQLNGEMQVVNGVVQSQIDSRPKAASYLSSSALLADGQGNYTAYVPNASGAEVNVRTPDGIHLAPGGGELLSQAVMASLRSTLHIDLPG